MTKLSFKVIAWVLLFGVLTLEGIKPIQAQTANEWLPPVYNSLTEFKIRNQQWFDSLSTQQQNLVRAAGQVIWNYQQQTGQLVYPNDENIRGVMQAIGASDSDYDLIAQVVNTNYIFANGTRRAQDFIQDTREFLNNLPY